MDKKTLIATAAGALVTLAVGAAFGWFTGVFERGTDALTEDQIRKVLVEENVAIINGETMTYGEALSKISTEQAVMKQALVALSEE